MAFRFIALAGIVTALAASAASAANPSPPPAPAAAQAQPAAAAPVQPAAPAAPAPAAHEYQDIPQGPTMVVVPAGEFDMGSPAAQAGRGFFEDPLHHVTIAHAFALSKTPVTFDQWDACVADGGCNAYKPDDKGWGRGPLPVINIDYDDARAYADWLSKKTGKHYRLPSESEWEYAARAGTSTTYWWGDAASHDHANYGADVCCSGLAVGADQWANTSPVGSFPANPFGLMDMNGNVMQLVADCWHESYAGAPADGSVWDKEDCSQRTTRGGAYKSPPAFIRAADRIWIPATARLDFVGFRVASDM
jgi:formylglycine-generating enzyme required for sulfatase activity